MTKYYPFSTKRHGKDLELCCNIAYNNDLSSYEKLHELVVAMYETFDGNVCWFTGEQLKLAKRCIMNASEFRATAKPKRP